MKELNLIKPILLFIIPVLVGETCKSWSFCRSVVACIYCGPVCAGGLRLCLEECTHSSQCLTQRHSSPVQILILEQINP